MFGIVIKIVENLSEVLGVASLPITVTHDVTVERVEPKNAKKM